jgi:hypothetical protein
MRVTLFTIVVFAACLVAIRPWGNYPLNDDWQYARASRLFVETGTIKIDTPIAPALVGQMLMAYPVIRIFGMNHAFLRALTWVMTAVIIFCVDRLLAIAGVTPSRRMFALVLLILNPLFLYFSNTFMTEVYGFAPALLAAVIYFESRRRGDSGMRWWIAIALLSIFAFWTRQFAAAVFPAIVVTWFFTDSRRKWQPVALSAVVFALGTAGYFLWVRLSGNFGFAFGDPLTRMVQVAGIAWGVETGAAIIYLTAFFLPMLLWIARSGWRDRSAYLIGAVCLVGAFVARGWFRSNAPSDIEFGGWTHRVFPYVTNVIFRTGVGPVTLDDVYHQAAMSRPDWSGSIWIWVEWVLLIATSLWGFAIRRIWQVCRGREVKSLQREVALFAIVWSLFSWILTVQAYRLEIFDRYYFPLALCLSILLPLLWPARPELRQQTWMYVAAAVFTASLGWFSIAGLHDHFRWNDARWNLAHWAFQNGVSPTNLAGGFEVNGWENYDNFQRRQGQMSLNCRVDYDDWFCLDATYRIGMNPIRGYQEWRQEQPSYWLAAGPPVRLLRMSGK